jgi:hypothetical protein
VPSALRHRSVRTTNRTRARRGTRRVLPARTDPTTPGDTTTAPRRATPDIIGGLAAATTRLRQQWDALTTTAWTIDVVEPADNADLGPVRLADLALFRLTELEVHSTDLDLGVRDWSDTFVRAALPFRLERLNQRHVTPGTLDTTTPVSGLLAYLVTAHPDHATALPAYPGHEAHATLEASSRNLLALLLGRPTHQPIRHLGNPAVAAAFQTVFPGP